MNRAELKISDLQTKLAEAERAWKDSQDRWNSVACPPAQPGPTSEDVCAAADRLRLRYKVLTAMGGIHSQEDIDVLLLCEAVAREANKAES